MPVVVVVLPSLMSPVLLVEVVLNVAELTLVVVGM
jgi:hypothetical protein